MIDMIVYKPSPYGLVFTHDKTLGFIIYNIKHEETKIWLTVQETVMQQ